MTNPIRSGDPVAAKLTQIRERQEASAQRHEGWRAPLAVLASADDVPALLAAVEAALAPHRPEGYVREIETCPEHGLRSGLAPSMLAAAQDACPDCRTTEHVACTERNCGMDPWPCPTYRAISAALLGEDSQDA